MLNRRQVLSVGSGFELSALLPEGYSEAWAQTPRRSLSLHVGVNEINPAAYPGVSNLNGCVSDAKAYRMMAIQAGFQKSKLLTDRDANIEQVTRYIYHAADRLQSGDTFFVSYAGHGASVNDRSNDEPDGRDETWCLHDGMLLDDYLYSLWARFKPGVRLLVISDSCHAGTVARVRAAARGLARELDTNDSATRSLFPGASPDGGTNASRGASAARESARILIETGQLENINPVLGLQPRTLSNDQAERAYQKNSERYYAQQRAAAGASNSAAVQASGILLAACQDHQLSWETSAVSAGGIFTRQMQEAFQQRNSFSGYSLMIDSVVRKMPDYQTPNFFPFGAEQDSFFNQPPFTV